MSVTPQAQLIVVGGANGAGKTTFAVEFAEQRSLPYLGADAIATEMLPRNPSAVRIAAGREFLTRIGSAIAGKESLVVESTLSGRTFARPIRDAIAQGFEVSIVYLFVDSADLCVDRVSERVQKGGHDVPEPDIRRRFARSLANFWHLYRRLAHNWVLIYNSGTRPQDVAIGSEAIVSVRDIELHRIFLSLVESDD
jgi:predicted ABC-type ATPase